MRRPLCLICVAFVVSVFISLQMNPLSESIDVEDGSRVIYTGEVYHKEYRYHSLILYLRNVNQVSSTKIPISDNKINDATTSEVLVGNAAIKATPEESVRSVENTVTEKGLQDMGILCYVEEGREPRLGSYVLVSGNAACFSQSRNPGGFDQKLYYRIQNIGFAMKKTVIIKESSTYSKYYEGLYQLRRCMEQVFDRTMSEKDASIMKAMILGNKAELDKESKQLYRKSGISHILAISGLHISLIGMGLYKLLRRVRIPTALAAVFAVVVMLMYGDMVGSSASAFRAIFMFALRMGAEVLHRTYDMLTALAMAAVGILLEQPLYIYHVGFLLSFGAIVGLGCMLEVLKTDTRQMLVNKKIQKRSEWIRNQCWNKITESLLGSGSIFLIHFPIMLSVYYEFPIYSFLLNMVIIPAMSLVMGLGLGCMLAGGIGASAGSTLVGNTGAELVGLGGLGVICEGIANILAFGCQVCLRIFESLCEWSMILPGAGWIVGEPAVWRVIVFYGVVLLLFLVHRYCKYVMKGKLCLPFLVKMIWILAAVTLLTQKTYSGLTITMLDVGQGDCIWLETNTGHHYLIDGGSTSEDKLGEYTIVPFLKQTGTDVVDAVFLTHLDTDHTSGILDLLRGESGIKVRKVVIAKAAIRDEAYDELAGLCRTQGVSLLHVGSGDVISDGSLSLEILHPLADYITDSRNAYSLVMKLEYGNFHALFTGDVEEDGELLVAEALPEDWECHLYKAAHHGSRNSNTLELLEKIRPKLAIISCEEDNSYGHPHAETLERLANVGSKVMVTKDCGAIIIEIDKEMEVRGWMESVREE